MRTVGDLFDAWLAHVDGRLEVATVIGYRSVVRQLRPLVGSRDLSSLTAADLDHLYRELLAGARSSQTVHRHHRVFHAALRQAVRWGWLSANPADAASPPRLRRKHDLPVATHPRRSRALVRIEFVPPVHPSSATCRFA